MLCVVCCVLCALCALNIMALASVCVHAYESFQFVSVKRLIIPAGTAYLSYLMRVSCPLALSKWQLCYGSVVQHLNMARYCTVRYSVVYYSVVLYSRGNSAHLWVDLIA